MTLKHRTLQAITRLRARLAGEGGFTMVIALGVLVVTSVLVAAMFVAIEGDVHISQHDLDGKRAYSAAQAGANAFLYQLNQNPDYWETCSNDTLAKTEVPGTGTSTVQPEYYSSAVIPANGNTVCTSNSISSLIDNATGSLRMEFTGYSGGPNSVVRTLVAQYRKLTPLDFVWYTVYEALDSAINGYTTCGVFYRAGRNSNCNINWVTGDQINGPMYTQDQYLIDGSPTFGRGPDDKIESLAPGTSNSDVCSGDNCGTAVFNGTPVPDAPFVPLPNDNSQLLTDATNYGKVFTGASFITLNNGSATVKNCPTSTCTTTTFSLSSYPIIYVTNGSGCTPGTYDPFSVSYPSSGCAGDAYVSETAPYTSSVTIATANNIIIQSNLQTTESGGVPTGTAVMGLVANQDVRVEHGMGAADNNAPGPCNQDNNASQTLTNLHIDAAVLALKHSFMVDEYDCGATLGTLTINGAIVQDYRGAVGTVDSNGNIYTGYVKDYTYDDRLAYLLPPYLFDISTGGWEVDRETLCDPGGSNSATAC
jgi:hypothetical protein